MGKQKLFQTCTFSFRSSYKQAAGQLYVMLRMGRGESTTEALVRLKTTFFLDERGMRTQRHAHKEKTCIYKVLLTLSNVSQHLTINEEFIII